MIDVETRCVQKSRLRGASVVNIFCTPLNMNDLHTSTVGVGIRVKELIDEACIPPLIL